MSPRNAPHPLGLLQRECFWFGFIFRLGTFRAIAGQVSRQLAYVVFCVQRLFGVSPLCWITGFLEGLRGGSSQNQAPDGNEREEGREGETLPPGQPS